MIMLIGPNGRRNSKLAKTLMKIQIVFTCFGMAHAFIRIMKSKLLIAYNVDWMKTIGAMMVVIVCDIIIMVAVMMVIVLVIGYDDGDGDVSD